MTLTELKKKNEKEFTFFNDVTYKILHGKKTKKPYLITFDVMSYYDIYNIEKNNKVGVLWGKCYPDLKSVKKELKFH